MACRHFYDFDPLFYNPARLVPSSLTTDAVGNFLPSCYSNFAVKPSNSKAVDPNLFQLLVNVKHFKADEVNVGIVDGFVVVTAKHVEHPDEHGFISRSFTRRYKLPEDVDADKVTSCLSQHGVLTIKAPKKVKIPSALEGGRIVPIEIQQPEKVEEGKKSYLSEGETRSKSNS